MNDGVSILVAIFLILVVLRWMLSGPPAHPPQRQRRQATRRHRVSPQMVETVRAMFPDIPTAAIQADLQRTGSVETTVDNVLRDGGLPVPVSAVPSQPASPSPSNHATNNTTSSSSSRKQHDNLIQRYKLDPTANGAVEPPKVWEADPTKRQHALQQRKAFMVMQARQKLMDKQKQKEQAAAAVVEDTPAATEKSFDDLSVEELNTLTPEQRRQHMLQAYEKKMMQA